MDATTHSSRTQSRRALLAGTVAGIGAWAASALSRAAPALANNGDVVTVGAGLTGTSTTAISVIGDADGIRGTASAAGRAGLSGANPTSSSTSPGIGVAGRATGATGGWGVLGVSDGVDGIGVRGRAFAGSGVSIGVNGEASSPSGFGVFGFGEGTGVRGDGVQGNGVRGKSYSGSASGVYGENVNRGYGVAGRSNAHGLGVDGIFAAATLGENTADGIGVWARSQGGVGLYADAINLDTAVAIKTRGITQFSRSGKATIRAGRASFTKTGIRIDPGSLVLATLQQDRSGVYVRSAAPNATGDSFTIKLNKAVGSDTKVGWFIVN